MALRVQLWNTRCYSISQVEERDMSRHDDLAAGKEADALGLVEDGFGTVAEAATFLGICRAKLYLMMDAGELVYAKIGKSRRIPWRALKKLAAESLVGGSARDAR
jgi:excisionase family DNA binding protein